MRRILIAGAVAVLSGIPGLSWSSGGGISSSVDATTSAPTRINAASCVASDANGSDGIFGPSCGANFPRGATFLAVQVGTGPVKSTFTQDGNAIVPGYFSLGGYARYSASATYVAADVTLASSTLALVGDDPVPMRVGASSLTVTSSRIRAEIPVDITTRVVIGSSLTVQGDGLRVESAANEGLLNCTEGEANCTTNIRGTAGPFTGGNILFGAGGGSGFEDLGPGRVGSNILGWQTGSLLRMYLDANGHLTLMLGGTVVSSFTVQSTLRASSVTFSSNLTALSGATVTFNSVGLSSLTVAETLIALGTTTLQGRALSLAGLDVQNATGTWLVPSGGSVTFVALAGSGVRVLSVQGPGGSGPNMEVKARSGAAEFALEGFGDTNGATYDFRSNGSTRWQLGTVNDPTVGVANLMQFTSNATRFNMQADGDVCFGASQAPPAHVLISSGGAASGDAALMFDGNGTGPAIRISAAMETIMGAGPLNSTTYSSFTIVASSIGVRNATPKFGLHLSSGIIAADGNNSALHTTGDIHGGKFTTTASTYTVGTGWLIGTSSTETIAAAGTITADSCGGLKKLSASGAVTTADPPITAAGTSNHGCCMTLWNLGTVHAITLDATTFLTTDGANLVLAARSRVRVCSDGVVWFQDGEESTVQ